MLDYINELLGEASTYRGIVTILTGLGIAISPESVAAITAGGMLAHGVLSVALRDKVGGSTPPVVDSDHGDK